MLLTHVNLAEDKLNQIDDRVDNFLIAAFRKTPDDLTAENIVSRPNRPWLLKITEEVNMNSGKMFDLVDMVHRLQQLRKSGRLVEACGDVKSGEE